MFESLQPLEPDAENRLSPYRLAAAFMIAAAVACGLFVTGAWIFLLGPEAGVLPPIMVLIIILIYALPITSVISFALYLLLERLNWLSAWSIVPVAFLQGVTMAYAFFGLGSPNDDTEAPVDLWASVIFILSIGLCAAIGGIVFCKMTIWHRPKAGGVSHGPE